MSVESSLLDDITDQTGYLDSDASDIEDWKTIDSLPELEEAVIRKANSDLTKASTKAVAKRQKDLKESKDLERLQKENKELQMEAKRTSDLKAKAEAQREYERSKEDLRKQSEILRKEEEIQRKKASEAAKVVPPKAPTPAATKAPGISLIF